MRAGIEQPPVPFTAFLALSLGTSAIIAAGALGLLTTALNFGGLRARHTSVDTMS
jgi:hypothetical protein